MNIPVEFHICSGLATVASTPLGKLKLRRYAWLCALFAGCAFATLARGVTLGWNASATPDVAEYILGYGTVSGTYPYSNNVGLAMSATVTNLLAGTTYYFVVSDVNSDGAASALSDEVSYSVPVSLLTNPMIAWTNPADVSYGTLLGPTQLDAVASVPGSFVYYPASGTVLLAGNGELFNVTFTPSNTTNYNVVSNTVTMNVLAAPLTITPSNQCMNYQAALPVLTTGYSGFVNGDAATNLTTQASLTTSALVGSPLGVYPIAASAAADPNYAISYVNGSLTVQPTVPPNLSIAAAGNGIIVSWPNVGSYTLLQNSNMAVATGWTPSAFPITTNANGTNSITVAQPQGNLFFCLANP